MTNICFLNIFNFDTAWKSLILVEKLSSSSIYINNLEIRDSYFYYGIIFANNDNIEISINKFNAIAPEYKFPKILFHITSNKINFTLKNTQLID